MSEPRKLNTGDAQRTVYHAGDAQRTIRTSGAAASSSQLEEARRRARMAAAESSRRSRQFTPVQPADVQRYQAARQAQNAQTAPRTIHQPVQHLQIDIVEERPHRDARIADEDIHTAELPDGRLDQRAALLGLRNIHAAVGRGPALLTDRPGDELQLLHAARPEHHPGALRGIFVCHRLTDARRGARDDDDLLLECFHIFLVFYGSNLFGTR